MDTSIIDHWRRYYWTLIGLILASIVTESVCLFGGLMQPGLWLIDITFGQTMCMLLAVSIRSAGMDIEVRRVRLQQTHQ